MKLDNNLNLMEVCVFCSLLFLLNYCKSCTGNTGLTRNLHLWRVQIGCQAVICIVCQFWKSYKLVDTSLANNSLLNFHFLIYLYNLKKISVKYLRASLKSRALIIFLSVA